MAPPNKKLFFTIIGLAILGVIGMAGVRLFLVDPLELTAAGQPPPIEVVVAPALAPWAEEAAASYNQAHPNSPVTIIPATALVPETRFSANPQSGSPPAAWLAEAGFVVELARNNGLDFIEPQSVASSGLAWGGYQDKLAAIETDYGPLDWAAVAAKAQNPADSLKLVIASPQNSAQGLAALISATAAHLETQALTGPDVSTADVWLTETLGDRNAHSPPRPAETFASVQGRTIGDVGLLALVSWRRVNFPDDFVIRPATPNVMLDYPVVLWNGPQASPDAQEAARAFREFLLAEAQQQALTGYGFEGPTSAPGGVQANGEAARRLLNWANRTLR